LSAPSKFLFEVDFAAGSKRQPAEPTITLAEHAVALAEAETAAHRRGYEQAKVDAGVDAERRIAAAIERIAIGLGEAARSLAVIEARLESEAVEVAVAVARKLAPALIAREPFAEIAALASECFRELTASPHLVVRVNDALYAAARERLDAVARSGGFEGKLVVLAEPTIALGDCRIEWADGGINRDGAAADAAISEAVGRYISARGGGGSKSDAGSIRLSSEARK
jgi:flagellar assembly protein FliH